MSEPMRVAASPVFKSNAVIIERGLIGIQTSTIRPCYAYEQRSEIQDLSKLHFALPNCVFRLLTFGDICRATHELHQIPGCVQDRMANGVDVSHRTARKKDSEFHFVIRLFRYCSIECPLPLGSILRMNSLEALFPSRHALCWIK